MAPQTLMYSPLSIHVDEFFLLFAVKRRNDSVTERGVAAALTMLESFPRGTVDGEVSDPCRAACAVTPRKHFFGTVHGSLPSLAIRGGQTHFFRHPRQL